MSPSSDPDSQNRRLGLFPFVIQKPPSPTYPSMASSSTFGGPCVHKHGNTHLWSGCYTVKDDGQLETRKTSPELEKIRNMGESLQQVKSFYKLSTLFG